MRGLQKLNLKDEPTGSCDAINKAEFKQRNEDWKVVDKD